MRTTLDPGPEAPLRVGEAAVAAEVRIQTLHYYERLGLIRPGRSAAGYRLYDAETVRSVRAIKRVQGLGYTLREIEELMRIRRRRRGGERLGEIVAAKMRDIDGRLRDLRRMKRTLADVAESCRCRGDLSKCDILDGLGEPGA